MKSILWGAVAAWAIGACSAGAQDYDPEWTAGEDALRQSIRSDYSAHLEALYQHFHAHPELSLREFNTAARLARELREAGYEVTEGVGGNDEEPGGVVAVFENGDGPTVMLRADMDGLPVREQTSVDYISTDTGIDRYGVESPVMHACAHDTHMTALVGAAREMMSRRAEWSGTLVLIGQPAEELGLGAQRMLDDGLFTRFPTPDFNLSFHTFSAVPAGRITYVPGFAMANVDTVDVWVQGRGGHGAYPHTTKDPVYLSAQIIVALQSLVSRELSPLDPGVITVGAINAGTKHNIISDEAHLQLTVRSYSDEVRQHLLSGIERVAHAQAASYGLNEDEYPRVVMETPYTPALYNEPTLALRSVEIMRERFGDAAVVEASSIMGGEDFSRYHRTEHAVPTFMFWVGGTTQERLDAYTESGLVAPSNHSPFFAPDAPEVSIIQATEAMTAVALDILATE